MVDSNETIYRVVIPASVECYSEGGLKELAATLAVACSDNDMACPFPYVDCPLGLYTKERKHRCGEVTVSTWEALIQKHTVGSIT